MSGGSVAFRLARREAVRRPWRSLLVLLLVLFPVVALTAIVVLTRTDDQPWPEEFADTAGAEDLRIGLTTGVGGMGEQSLDESPATQDRILELIPEDSHVVEVNNVSDRVRTTERTRTWGTISDRPLDDPISAGLIRRIDGRVPVTSNEVLLTTRMARDLEVSVGDVLELDRPAPYRGKVVGVAEWGARLDWRVMVIGTGDDPDALRRLFGDAGSSLLIDLPAGFQPDAAFTQAMIDAGANAGWLPSGVFGDPVTQTTIVWTWIGGGVIFIILGVVITAAFAVTARRQLTLLGQLMANGSDDRTLRLTLVLQGTIIGVAGGVVGVVLALAGLHLFQPLIEEHFLRRRIGAFDIRFADIAPVVLIAVVAATGSALLPARTAIRTSVLQALAGRRPVGPYPARLVARGAIAAVAGLGLLAVATVGTVGRDAYAGGATLMALTGIAGALALILGTCAMTPAIIARLEPLAGSLRGTARLAARSIARQRVRTGAVVAAIAVVAAGAVAGSSAYLTAETRDAAHSFTPQAEDLVSLHLERWEVREDDHWYSVPVELPAEAVDEVLSVIPDGRVIPTRTGRWPWEGNYSSVQIVDDELAEAIDFPTDALAALDDGAVLAFGWWDGDQPVTGPVEQTHTLHGEGFQEVGSMRVVVLPQHEGADLFMGSMFTTADTAEGLGYDIGPGPVVVQSPQPLTGDQRDAMSDVASDLSYDYSNYSEAADAPHTSLHVSYPYETFELSRTVLTAVVVGGATILVLAVVALGLALSAAETRDERDVLAAVGAPPRALRRLAASKAAVLAITGTLIGIPLGFIPVMVMVRAASSGAYTAYTAVFPWVQVGLLAVLVPIVASAAALAASGLALRLRPVTASTMAFD